MPWNRKSGSAPFRPSSSLPRKTLDMALTGAKKPLPERRHLPVAVSPPEGTIMCTWGWYCSWRPHVCSTEVAPVLAPRYLGSDANALTVSHAQRNRSE